MQGGGGDASDAKGGADGADMRRSESKSWTEEVRSAVFFPLCVCHEMYAAGPHIHALTTVAPLVQVRDEGKKSEGKFADDK